MSQLIQQVIAITDMNLRSIPRRLGLSLSTIFSVALVISVLLCFLAMSQGFEKTLRGTGAEDVAVVLRSGAEAEINSSLTSEQYRLMQEGPGISRDKTGIAQVSGELYVIVDAIKRSSRTEANIPLRGLGTYGTELRKNARIIQGRMFHSGMNEIVVGKSLLAEFEGFELGRTIKLGSANWTVVGVFESPGTVFESELWADVNVIQSFFNRQGSYQVMRIKLESAAAVEKLKAYAKADPRLQLDVKTEKDFYIGQSGAASDLIFYLGWPLSIAMAIGALAGATNTMYNAVASRAREIITLRTIGYSGFATIISTLLESSLLAVIGGIIGAVLSYLLFDGLTASTLGGNFTQVVFRFDLNQTLVIQGIILALVIGILGGAVPAYRAARMKLSGGAQE